MFESFPKVRPELPEQYKRIYETHYRENRDGATLATGVSRWLESWLHRKVASDLTDTSAEISTLEIGAGTLNQLQYEPDVGPYDIVEPFSTLYSGAPELARVRNIYSDISEIPPGVQYDRISAIATFEHICNLAEVIAICGRLLRQDGSLRVSIPSEGTFLWTAAWKLTTGLEFRLRHGLDYGTLMAHEHVNTAREIYSVLKYFFAEINSDYFGLNGSVSFYQFHACSNPNADRCEAYLDQIASDNCR